MVRLCHSRSFFRIRRQAKFAAVSRRLCRRSDAWHPVIAKGVLKNWQMDEAVCESVGAQAEVHIVRTGPPTLTDVLIASIRLATRMRDHDTENLNAGGAFARLDLNVEVCKSLIAQASEETRALQRALRP